MEQGPGVVFGDLAGTPVQVDAACAARGAPRLAPGPQGACRLRIHKADKPVGYGAIVVPDTPTLPVRQPY